jgi:hypothetical protein
MPTTYAIPDGRTVFAATTYTGNGSSILSVSNAVNGVSFKPDLVWHKIRSGTTQGIGVFDSVRGTTGQSLDTSATTAEGTWVGSNSSDYGYVSSFDTGGFSVNDGATATTGGYVNYSGRTYVAWQWKASNTTAVTNTSGTITSSISANPTAGFSVVTYTGNGTAGATIGHGIGVAPSMVIVKNRGAGGDSWQTYHIGSGAAYRLFLNSTGARVSDPTGAWNSGTPTTTVFTAGSNNSVNGSGVNYVAYCWAPIAGYSAFGSYVGNTTTDNAFLYTGFSPTFFMVKCIDSTGNWLTYDNTRAGYNGANYYLFANGTYAGDGTDNPIDFLSNGIKIRADGGIGTGTYIYAAFAQNPFKYANAR